MKQKWNCLAQASIHIIKFTSRIRYIHERRNTKEVCKMGLLLTSIKRIRPKNIGCWLTDQMSRPNWFRRLFLHRTAWGAFSIYSHIKRSNGKPKIAYPTKSKAENAVVGNRLRSTSACSAMDGMSVKILTVCLFRRSPLKRWLWRSMPRDQQFRQWS